MSEEKSAPNGEALAKFFAKKIVEGFPGNKAAKNEAVDEIELAKRIGEIEVETQTAGASYIKAYIIDPEWALTISGWLKVKEGLLSPIEVEFPEGSNWHWVLCAVEGSTNVTEPNLTVTFEDRIVYFMRQYFGTKHAPPGTQTRAQFIRDLVRQIGEHGEEKVGFICPSLNVVQPIETEAEKESKKTKTEQTAQEEKEEQEKKGGLGAGSFPIKGVPATKQQAIDVSIAIRTAKKLKAPPLALEALIVAGIGESTFHRESSNAGHSGIWQSASIPGDSNEGVEKQAEAFLKGGESFQAGGAIKLAEEKNAHYSPSAIATMVEAGGEPASFYEAYLTEARKIIAESGGATSTEVEEATSDVGQLQRGTTANPDEDSFECAVRLATQVDWSFFSDNHNFFYMDGPNFMRQKPALYVDIPRNHIKTPQGESKYGAILSPSTFNFDNTTYEYRISHKLKTRIQRKSKAVKPASPAEVKLLLECGIDDFHAGQVFKFENSGPVDGVWIITNSRRAAFKDTYTEFILEPPIEPLPEPRAESTEAGSGEAAEGSALAAFDAASELSSFELPYKYGGGHGTGALAKVEKGGEGLDCSSSTCYVLHKAGLFPSTTAQVSGELEHFGEAGEGKELTVWASAEHVYIEFHIPGHEVAQMNTNGPQNGPRLYSIKTNPTYNGEKGEGSGGPFVARHPKGL